MQERHLSYLTYGRPELNVSYYLGIRSIVYDWTYTYEEIFLGINN